MLTRKVGSVLLGPGLNFGRRPVTNNPGRWAYSVLRDVRG